MDMDALAETCLKAADLIAEKGLAKGVLRDDTGALCNNGAIMTALDLHEDYLTGTYPARWPMDMLGAFTAIKEAQSRVMKEMNLGTITPWEYNDLDDTSAEDIILLLKHTAERIRTMILLSLCSFIILPGGMIKFIPDTAV